MLYQWIISLPMMVCFFWSIYFMIRYIGHHDEPRVNASLILFFVASTVLYVNHWLFFSDAATSVSTWLYLLANLSVYPLYFMYLRALTRTANSWDNYVLFVPTLIMAVLFPLNAHYQRMDEDRLFLFARICFAIQVVWVWVRGYALLRVTRRNMDNVYSDDRSYLLAPAHRLLVLIGIIAFFSTMLNVIGRDFFTESTLVVLPAIIMSVLLYSLGYVAAHTLIPQETVAQEETTNESVHTTTEETDELMHKIATALREKRLFANPDFTIVDLAAAVNSNRTYVSNCINRRTGLSFSQYVTRYRVEHAQTILRDPKYSSDHEAATAAIALSGFTSNATFYRAFKEITRITPLQYRHLNLGK